LSLFLITCGGGGGSPTESNSSSIQSITTSALSINGNQAQSGNVLKFGLFPSDYSPDYGWVTDISISVDVSGSPNYVECFIGGQSFGKKYSAPFTWEIDVFQSQILAGDNFININIQNSDLSIINSGKSVRIEKYHSVSFNTSCPEVSGGHYSFQVTRQSGNTPLYGPPYHNYAYTGTMENVASSDKFLLQAGVYQLQIGGDLTYTTDIDIDTNLQYPWERLYLDIENSQYVIYWLGD
jgi:hypothetical protein